MCNMFCSENTGLISECPHQKNTFCWEVPNYFAFQIIRESDYNDTPPEILIYAHIVNSRIASSPLFSAFNNKWRLALILNGRSRSGKAKVGFFLWKMTTSNERPDISVKLLLLDRAGNVWQGGSSCYGDVDFNGCFGNWEFISLDTIYDAKEEISPAGILRFVCVMEVQVPIIINSSDVSDNESELSDQEPDHKKRSKPDDDDEIATCEDLVEFEVVPETKGVDRLLQNLKNIFLEKQGSDAILKVEDRDFKVHKTILIARSPVFASMFKYDTKENTTGAVEIPDCLAAAFEDFLLYLYTASTDTMSQNNVFDLYYAADKYQVNDLKSDCVEYMANNLSDENFCAVMSFSLKLSESELQEKAIDFFCDNFKTIIKTVQWQRYLRDYPSEANELYIKAVNA